MLYQLSYSGFRSVFYHLRRSPAIGTTATTPATHPAPRTIPCSGGWFGAERSRHEVSDADGGWTETLAQAQRASGHVYPADVRYRQGLTVERVNGRLKDEFGAAT